MEKLNRAQRRKSRFGTGRSTEHGGWPTSQPNPVFGAEPATDEATVDKDDEKPADQAAAAPQGTDDPKA